MTDMPPPEWAPHRATWLAYPYRESDWPGRLPAVQREWLALCRAIAEVEPVEVLVPSPAERTSLKAELRDLPVAFHIVPYDDIWLRDTAPIFGHGSARVFAFNGWGGRYPSENDRSLGERIAKLWRRNQAQGAQESTTSDRILEGGAIDWDGEGTLLASRACLLGTNRRGFSAETAAEAWLLSVLGAERVLWLDGTLAGDHTDGHADMLARFIGPGRIVVMEPDPKQPSAEVLARIEASLQGTLDARGRPITIETVCAPSTQPDDEPIPRTYLNFLFVRSKLLVPAYGLPSDEAARAALARLLPQRKVELIRAAEIIRGGGALHCASQQEPLDAVTEQD